MGWRKSESDTQPYVWWAHVNNIDLYLRCILATHIRYVNVTCFFPKLSHSLSLNLSFFASHVCARVRECVSMLLLLFLAVCLCVRFQFNLLSHLLTIQLVVVANTVSMLLLFFSLHFILHPDISLLLLLLLLLLLPLLVLFVFFRMTIELIKFMRNEWNQQLIC